MFESDFIAFSCFKMAGCLSEEELEIAISLNGSFVAVFSSCPRTILKHNFKFATKYEFNSEFCSFSLVAPRDTLHLSEVT